MITNKTIKKARALHKKITKATLTTDKPFKRLTVNVKKSYGRNAIGHKTVAAKFRGSKKQYRIISNHKDKIIGKYVVLTIERDPNRSCFIALILNEETKHYAYIVATQNMKVGQEIENSREIVDLKEGNATQLINIPVGVTIHNIQGKYVRSAGSSATVVATHNDRVMVRVASGKTMEFAGHFFATIGAVSNANHMNQMLYKAGNNFYKGKRSKVRGVAMNPVDHPHGGGEGRTGTKGAHRNRTGRVVKGRKTSNSRRKVTRILN